MSNSPKRKKFVIKKKGGSPKPPAKTDDSTEESESNASEARVPHVAENQKKKGARKKLSLSTTSDGGASDGEGTEISVEEPAEVEETFKFYCVYCGQKLSAATTASGRAITCPSCENTIKIPQPL